MEYENINATELDQCVNATKFADPLVLGFGTAVYLLVWPFLVMEFRCLPIGRVTAVWIGSLGMVLTLVLTQENCYEVLGEQDNLQTLCLLLGMMLFAQYLDREGLMSLIFQRLLDPKRSLYATLWIICVITGVLASVITNDAACVMLTPIILQEHNRNGRKANEILPLLLAIATSANIGSAATVMGNPQNAYIASVLNINLAVTFSVLLPAAVLGIFLNTGLLYLYCFAFYLRTSKSKDEIGSKLPNGNVADHDSFRSSASMNNHLNNNYNNENDPLIKVRYNSSQDLVKSEIGYKKPKSLEQSWMVIYDPEHCDKINIPSAAFAPCKNCYYVPSYSKTFCVLLIFMLVVCVVLLCVPESVTNFDLGLVPVGCATVLMLYDGVVNKRNSIEALNHVDWGVLMLFCGLFIWLDGFKRTGLPRKLYDLLQDYMYMGSIQGVLVFTAYVIVGSNLISNVPLVILLVDYVNCLKGCTTVGAGLMLAWISTVAGNFTLIGSVANLIVAEKAKQQCDYTLGFISYFKFGLTSTTIVLFTGLPIVWFLSSL